MRRWAPFWISLAASVALSLALWALIGPIVVGAFLLPALFWPRSAQRQCPTCGYATVHPAVRYCPHDGTRLAADP